MRNPGELLKEAHEEGRISSQAVKPERPHVYMRLERRFRKAKGILPNIENLHNRRKEHQMTVVLRT